MRKYQDYENSCKELSAKCEYGGQIECFADIKTEYIASTLNQNGNDDLQFTDDRLEESLASILKI